MNMALSTDSQYLAHEFKSTSSLYALISGWKVNSVRDAINAHDLGSSFLLSGGVSVVSSRYSAIFGSLSQRVAPPLGLQREVFGGDRGPARRAREGFTRVMGKIDPYFGDIFKAKAMMGFQVLHHTWIPSPDASTLEPQTKLWPAAFVWWNPLNNKLEAITTEGRIPIVDGDGKWTVIGTGDQPFLNGAVRVLGEPWAAGRTGERDEAALSAYLGRMCPIGILPASIEPNTPEGDDFLESVKDLGDAQSGGIFPNGSDIKTLPNVDSNAAALFAGFLNRRERACAIALLGTDGTMSPTTQGVYVSPLFGHVAFAVVRSDTADAGGGLTRFGNVYGEINYGLSPEDAPGYRWLLPDPTEAERLAALSKRYLDAAVIVKAERAANLDVTQDRITAIYGALDLPVPLVPETKSKAPILPWHVETGIVSDDEARASLGLDPFPDGVGSIETLAERKKNAPEAPQSEPVEPADPLAPKRVPKL